MPATLLALLLLFSPAVDLAAPDGRTLWVTGALEAGAPWELEVRPSADGALVWVELDGPDDVAGLDLDLIVEPMAGDGERRRSTSHLADEALLVRADGPLLVRVVGGGAARFRLGLTPVEVSGALDQPGRPLRGVLDGAGGLDAPVGRVHLVELGPLAWEAARLHARRTEGAGDLDLLVADARLDLVALALTDGPDERVQPPAAAPGDPGGAARYALLVARGGPLAYELRLETPPPGQKAFPGSRLGRFLDELATTPEQRLALEALRRTPDFLRIRSYVDDYPGGLPLRLRAVPGLRSGGVERFGTYSRGTLTINPTIPAHQENVQELLDTLLHELVHALLDLPRGPRYPLAADVLDAAHDPRLRDLDRLPIRRGGVAPALQGYLDDHYGPSASDPARDYSDINSGAQRLIVKVIEETHRRTGLGRETIVFDSVRARVR
ncbi:MAG: hypothetical protein M9894_39610 [Planctomycetes bacterium]|nr:hypothetical protein [Planctomycetota bacterium]